MGLSTGKFTPHTLITKYTIIILQIQKEIYSQYILPHKLSDFTCPACRTTGDLKYHSKYKKYHYEDILTIHILKCLLCKKYHAMIPSFSLPGTSLGTKEVEQYIISREKGHSRKKAGAVLLDKGVSFKHLGHIEKLIRNSHLRVEALVPQPPKTKSFSPGFILTANLLCLENKVNAVFCNRVNILIFHKTKPGQIFSNDIGTPGPATHRLDSS